MPRFKVVACFIFIKFCFDSSCSEGETALHVAAVENHVEMAKLLVQRGASVNEDAL